MSERKHIHITDHSEPFLDSLEKESNVLKNLAGIVPIFFTVDIVNSVFCLILHMVLAPRKLANKNAFPFPSLTNNFCVCFLEYPLRSPGKCYVWMPAMQDSPLGHIIHN